MAIDYPCCHCHHGVVRIERNVLSAVPRAMMGEVAAMVKAIYASEGRPVAEAKAEQVAGKLDGMRLTSAAKVLRAVVSETLTYLSFPRGHWRRIRTDNLLERLMRKVRRRTRVAGAFPDGRRGHAGRRPSAACGVHRLGEERAYLDMKQLRDRDAKAKTSGEGDGGGRRVTDRGGEPLRLPNPTSSQSKTLVCHLPRMVRWDEEGG